MRADWLEDALIHTCNILISTDTSMTRTQFPHLTSQINQAHLYLPPEFLKLHLNGRASGSSLLQLEELVTTHKSNCAKKDVLNV